MKQKLSGLEEYFLYRSKLNLHSCFYVGIKLNELPQKHQLISALKYAVIEHERLSCNVFCEKSDNEVYLKSITEPFLFDDIAEYHHDWDQLKQNEINCIFQTYNFTYNVATPLWKILIIPSQNEMLLVTDHVLMDGISAVHVWETFMEGLREEASIEDDETIYSPLFSSSTDLISASPFENWPIPWSWRIIRQLASSLYYLSPKTIVTNNKNLIQFANYSFPESFLEYEPTGDTDLYKVRNTNHQWEFRLLPAHLKNVLSECKAHNVSLTSFLGALVCLSFEKTAREVYKGTYLKMDLPMNTRKICRKTLQFLSDEELVIGNFVAPIEYKHKLHQDLGLWDTASEIQEAVKYSSKDKVIDTMNNVKLLEVVSPQQFIKDKINLNSGPSSTFEITNLGLQAFKDACNTELPFHVVDAIFNEPQGMSDIFTLSVISTPAGGLHCCVSYPNTLVEELKPNWQYIKEHLHLY
ncbi:hypothetical protein SEUBUCD646_0G04610 [Saccharomyces eubayanus]|uniref:SLI1-like protein n=1 Tax=Saccharomyces eubayanus TaxID=1080349 RepID=A0ABN8VSY8_SACEU|nr:hypothetical protein SEUBUCD650_0G04600 [Saccharomyces eubayanus]CAI2029015.1 hypothetical protein SEUBUCD646_0G04610 [Saccharomyces eubayanus]